MYSRDIAQNSNRKSVPTVISPPSLKPMGAICLHTVCRSVSLSVNLSTCTLDFQNFRCFQTNVRYQNECWKQASV